MSTETKYIKVSAKEIDHMTSFILVAVGGAKKFTERVEKSIQREKDSEPQNFVNENEVAITEADIDRHIESVFEEDYAGLHVPTILYENVHEFINGELLREMEREIGEMIQDQQSYVKDPLGYHGLSQKDFL